VWYELRRLTKKVDQRGRMEVLPELVSLGAGFASGWFFERRASISARGQNEELIRQISVLRTSMSNVSGRKIVRPGSTQGRDLTSEVTQRAISTQDPEGRVDRASLIAHFVERGFGHGDVEAAIGSLCSAGIAKQEGSWLQIG
jgi:hypothetical protein